MAEAPLGVAPFTPGAHATRPREPGLLSYVPGRERYRIAGDETLTLSLAPGDEVTLTDREGGQICEIVAITEGGGDGLAALGLKAEGSSRTVAGLAGSPDPSAMRLLALLKAGRLEPESAPAARAFGPGSAAGSKVCVTAERPLLLLLGTPGEPMPAAGGMPPTAIGVEVQRKQFEVTESRPLPPPLAEPRLEIRVNRASTEAYEVAEGEYIQVIDVDGRQCTDFICLTRCGLDGGQETGIHLTATRTMLGATYPGPGLSSKFFDPEMRPLVEVVRDTCRRHDAFNFACTRKYYENVGYPGHVNCTDNFNAALEPYGVRPRAGWEAINLFYNTWLDDHHRISFDASWSRPGDYVLFRAATDLICGSSACPDDIDAINGWNPTDIHVRVYPAKNLFSKAVAYRMTPDSEAKLTRETAFHPRTSALTRNFTEYRGYWMPTSYTGHGKSEEYYACREKATILDLSPLRKFEVLGPDAEALMQWTLTRDVRRLALGQVVYSAMCYEHGGMLDDGTLFKLGDHNFRWVGGDEYDGEWLREQAKTQGLQVLIKSATDQLHNLAVQGPRSREILKRVVWTPPTRPSIEELGWFRFTVGRIGDFEGVPLVVSRTGYTGELGYEVFCHPKDALAVWDAIWRAGGPDGLTPMGFDALDTLRIEAGLAFAGYEFDDQTDPFEAGIGFTVPKNKQDDYVGRAALAERRAHPQRCLVGLELKGNEPARHGDCVHAGRAQVGVVTSGTFSPILRRNLALCRLNVGYAESGTALEVGKLDGHQRRIAATVVPFPFYDPEKTRVRA